MNETLELLKFLNAEERAELETLLLMEEQTNQVVLSDLKIRTKDKALVSFVPNPVQVLYLDMLATDYPPFDWRNGVYTLRGVREDTLKARQQGMSTLWQALYFLDTINTPLTETHIYAHDGESTERLFRMVQRFYQHLPPHKKRPLRYSNKKELVFADIDSGLYVGMVGGGALGRGGTVNNAHLSERAWNDKYEELELGLFQAIPDDGNITRETTANGLNEYYNERQREHRGESGFKPRFFGWNLTPEYRLPSAVSEGQRGDAGVFLRLNGDSDNILICSDEEMRLRDAHGLNDEQLLWRREKLKALKEKFVQEYPITEAEAFISSGNPYFDRPVLLALSERLQTTEYDPLPDLVIPPDFGRLRKLYADGDLKIWQNYKDDRDYIVTCDPAGGVNTDGKRDYCSASVLCVQTWTQVAHLWGRWEPFDMGQILAEMGWAYGEALVGVLRANHGYAVLDALLHKSGYPPQRGNAGSGVYFFTPESVTEQTRQTTPETRQAGWPENTMTKPFMLDKLAEAITIEPGLTINSRQTVQEMLTFVHLPGGKSGGEAGSHDDCVSDLALGAALLNLRFERKSKVHLTEPPARAPYGQKRTR